MRILVVEDHPKMREIATRILDKLGFDNIATAVSADEALELLGQSQVDLVLCDFHLEGDDGLYLHRAMMNNPNLSDIPFVLITADPDLEPVVKAARQGVNLLNKPFTPTHLATTLRDLLGPENFPASD